MSRLIWVFSWHTATLLGFSCRGTNQSCINRWVTGWVGELVLYYSANRPWRRRQLKTSYPWRALVLLTTFTANAISERCRCLDRYMYQSEKLTYQENVFVLYSFATWFQKERGVWEHRSTVLSLNHFYALKTNVMTLWAFAFEVI